MLKIRWSHDRLIFNMGIPNLGKTVFILRPGPRHYSFPHLNDIFNQTGAVKPYIICLVQDCSISSELAIEILQSCTKPSTYSSYWTCNLDFGKYQWIPKIVINITKDAKYFWIGYFDKRTCSLSAWRISGHARNSTIIAHCTPKHGALCWLRAVIPIHIMAPPIRSCLPWEWHSTICDISMQQHIQVSWKKFQHIKYPFPLNNHRCLRRLISQWKIYPIPLLTLHQWKS